MKTLLIDIETSPNTVFAWGLFDQNIGINQIIASGSILCFAAKWLDSDEVIFDSIPKSGKKRMLKRVHTLLDEADAVIHFNGKKFDVPVLNKEMVLLGMPPPSPYKQIDLYHVAKRQFRFPSNKLDYIAQALGLGSKVRHAGFEMWIACMNNDEAAWVEMEKYNRQDVILLADLYERLRPWISNHPNRGLYDEPGVPVCPTCGSTHLQRRGKSRTITGIFARFQCVDCGAWSRCPTQDNDKLDRTILMRQAA